MDLGEAQVVYEDKLVMGIAGYGERVCYKYNVKRHDTNLDVMFKMYSGLATQSINPHKLPADYHQSAFKTELPDPFDTSIRVTPEMRRQHGTGFYFICVFAHMTSSYSLMVHETSATAGYQAMETGFAYHSRLEGDQEKKIFLYQVPRLDFDVDRVTIDFNLKVLDGGPVPRLAIKYCNHE